MILVDENAASVATVDYVFQVLLATWGQAWERSLGNAPPSDVKTVWASALDGVSHSKSARKSIAWALSNLPERPMNAREFLALCRQAPAVELPRLPEPAADPARVAAELAKLAPVRAAAVGATDPKAWAHRILSRHASGERLSPTVLTMARAATGVAA